MGHRRRSSHFHRWDHRNRRRDRLVAVDRVVGSPFVPSDGSGLPSRFARTFRSHASRSAPPSCRRGRRAPRTRRRKSAGVARREEDEPAVVAQIPFGLALRGFAAFERDDLRRARLARDVAAIIRARPPVPAPLTTIHSPSRTALIVSGFNCTTERGAGGGTSFQPVHRQSL